MPRSHYVNAQRAEVPKSDMVRNVTAGIVSAICCQGSVAAAGGGEGGG